ncbi:MAG: hypothetical protein V4440_14615 [Pseudomonadota bacterium]
MTPKDLARLERLKLIVKMINEKSITIYDIQKGIKEKLSFHGVRLNLNYLMKEGYIRKEFGKYGGHGNRTNFYIALKPEFDETTFLTEQKKRTINRTQPVKPVVIINPHARVIQEIVVKSIRGKYSHNGIPSSMGMI